MRTIALIFVAALLLENVQVFGGQALAGSIQAAFANGSDFTDWVCGAPMPAQQPSEEVSCGIAGFDGCSSCGMLMITNQSGAHLKFHLHFGESQFIDTANNGYMFCGNHPGEKQRFLGMGCSDLDPGDSCAVPVEFCPEQSGISHGRLGLIANDSGKTLATFKLR